MFIVQGSPFRVYSSRFTVLLVVSSSADWPLSKVDKIPQNAEPRTN